jgi:cytochrome c553
MIHPLEDRMRQDWRSATLMVLGLAMAASLASVPGVAAQAPAAPVASSSAPGGPYTSAKACASCHKLIHQYWSESAHARSATSPAYLAGLESAVAAASDKQALRVDCVWCHAPTGPPDGGLRAQAADHA